MFLCTFIFLQKTKEMLPKISHFIDIRSGIFQVQFNIIKYLEFVPKYFFIALDVFHVLIDSI